MKKVGKPTDNYKKESFLSRPGLALCWPHSTIL
jgi:hypothetical protein